MERPLLVGFVTRTTWRAGEDQLVVLRVYLDPIALFEFPFENLNRQGVLNQPLDRSLERARPINRVVSFVREQRLG
jgi:hypothetical protein